MNRCDLGKDIFYYEWLFDKYTLEYDIFCLCPAVCHFPLIVSLLFPPNLLLISFSFILSFYIIATCIVLKKDFSSFQCIFITLRTKAAALIMKMHQKMQNRIIEHYILSVHILSSFSSSVLCLQAGGDSSSVVAASRQHPTGFAPPAAAVCPESI